MNKHEVRILVVLVFVILIIVFLSSCSIHGMQTLGDQSKKPTTFMLVEQYDDFYTVVDSDTGVMYAVSNGGCNDGDLTLLVNADGTPKQFPGFDAREDRT